MASHKGLQKVLMKWWCCWMTLMIHTCCVILLLVHVHALMKMRWSSKIGRLCSEMKYVNDEEQCLSASVWKMKTKKEVQMLEHSSHKEGTFMWAEGLKVSILVSIIWLNSSPRLSLQKPHNLVIYGPCSAVRVLTNVLIKQLVTKHKYSRKCEDSYFLTYNEIRHSLPFTLDVARSPVCS